MGDQGRRQRAGVPTPGAAAVDQRSALYDALQGAHETLGVILEFLDEGVLVVDDRHRVVFANPALRSLVERGANAGTGQPCAGLFPDASRARLRDLLDRWMTEPGRAELDAGGGPGRQLALAGRPLRTERFAGAIVLVADAAGGRIRERAPGEMGDHERHRVFDLSPVGMCVLDRTGRVDLANPAFAAMLEAEASPVAGIGLLDLVRDDERARLSALWAEVQTGDRGGFDVELRGRAPLVRPEWLRLLVAIGADRDPAGQVLLVVEDVTARRTTSDALLAPMEARSGAYEQLQRMGDITARSLAIVSHEFRTGLFGMQGYSEILCRREFPPATVQKYAASINSDAKRMGRLINDLLDLNRMEVGREELQLEEVACGRLVAEVVERTRMGSPRHEISAVLAPDVPTIVADRDRVIQVLGNLLTNAVKYSPEGGPVVVRLGRHPEGVMIEVTDQGIGIPANMLDEVFEPFTRSQDHGASSVKGTGLGLPIVRHIVRLHGGRVWVESREGVGSTFRVVLPPHPPGAAPNQPPDDDGSAVDPAGQGGTPGSHD